MADRYWVGGAGTWDTTSTTNWSTGSGGSSGASVPTTADNVFFDGSSGTPGAVTITGAASCLALSVSVTGWVFTAGATPTMTVAGAFTIDAGTSYSGTIPTTFTSTSSVNITTNGVTLGGNATFNGAGGTWVLQDNFTIPATATCTLTTGTLDLNTKKLTCGSFSSSNSNARSIGFGAGGSIDLTLSSNGTVWTTSTATNFSFTGTSKITSSTANSRTFTANVTGGTVSNVLSFEIGSSGALTFTNASIFRNLTFLSGATCALPTNAFSWVTDLTLVSTMSVPASSSSATYAGTNTTGTGTLTTAGLTFDKPITQNGSLGTLQLGDDLTMGSTRTLTFTNGTFNANNKNVTAGLFATAAGTKTVTMGSGTWTATGTGTCWNFASAATVNKDTSTIVLSNTSTSARTFAGGGRVYNNLTIGGTTGTSTLTISGSNTFATFSSTKTVAHTILFTAGTTQTVTTFAVTGTAGNVVTLNSTAAGSQFTLSQASGTVNAAYMSIKDSVAQGGATWNATNSTDGGNNSGWTITAPVVTVGGQFMAFF